MGAGRDQHNSLLGDRPRIADDTTVSAFLVDPELALRPIRFFLCDDARHVALGSGRGIPSRDRATTPTRFRRSPKRQLLQSHLD